MTVFHENFIAWILEYHYSLIKNKIAKRGKIKIYKIYIPQNFVCTVAIQYILFKSLMWQLVLMKCSSK